MGKTASATRFFGQSADRDLPRLVRWVEGALAASSHVIVAVNVDGDRTGSVEFLAGRYPSVTVLPVTPWGKFVSPLNAIAMVAAGQGADSLFLSSVEFPPTAAAISGLREHLDVNTLVAGLRLPEHDFRPEAAVANANGLQVPWNTFALYDLAMLCRIGFPLAGDSPFAPDLAGVEELSCFALYQKVYPDVSCKLVELPGIAPAWDMSGWDKSRHDAHAAKMVGKIRRPATHLSAMHLAEGPTVSHVPAALHYEPEEEAPAMSMA